MPNKERSRYGGEVVPVQDEGKRVRPIEHVRDERQNEGAMWNMKHTQRGNMRDTSQEEERETKRARSHTREARKKKDMQSNHIGQTKLSER